MFHRTDFLCIFIMSIYICCVSVSAADSFPGEVSVAQEALTETGKIPDMTATESISTTTPSELKKQKSPVEKHFEPRENCGYSIIPVEQADCPLAVKEGSVLPNAELVCSAQAEPEAKQFFFTRTEGSYTIRSAKSELPITRTGKMLMTGSDKDIDIQTWLLRENEDKSISILTKGKDMAFTYSKGKVILSKWGPSPNTSQKFQMLRGMPIDHPLNGVYKFSSATYSGFFLSEKDGSVCMKRNEESAGKFQFIYCGDGYYRVLETGTGRFMTIEGNRTANGAKVIFSEWNGSDGQQWQLEKRSSGAVIIISRIGMALRIGSDRYGISYQHKDAVQAWVAERCE